MSFDLFVFLVDRPLSDRAAARRVSRLQELDANPDVPTAANLAGFLADIRARYPDLDGRGPEESAATSAPRIPVAIDAYARHALLSLPWTAVATVAPQALEVAERHGLALFDPQAAVVHLPPALGPRRPTDWSAAQAQGTSELDPSRSGITVRRRGPPAPQKVPRQRARHVADLSHARPMKRSAAALQLAARDTDPETTATLRKMLAHDPDIGVRSIAALSLGTVRDVASFPAIVGLLRELIVRGDSIALDHAYSAARAMTDLARLLDKSAIDEARMALLEAASRAEAVRSRQAGEFRRLLGELDLPG